MAKAIMVQGTMSNAGKSLLAAGLCRIFKQDGYRVAPFKSQNMALNSFITEDGLEMGRAQVMQAEAAGIRPSVLMNPILLKPTNDVGSQVIVNGEVLGTMSARDYFKYKKTLVPDVMKAYNALAAENDIIVIEGAGSPAEINLKDEDIVNMGMAKMAKAPVLLVGDIDRGGVFAQLIGTVELLEDDEKAMVKGLIINKFRGDKTILDPGVVMLEERSGIPVVGVAPYLDIQVEDEDSLGETLSDPHGVENGGSMKGMGLLPMETVFAEKKTRTRVQGHFGQLSGVFAPLSGAEIEGYEIHMGESILKDNAGTATKITDSVSGKKKEEGAFAGNVCGTYIHGVFDKEASAEAIIRVIGEKKGIDVENMTGVDFAAFKEQQYDILAAELRKHLDMKKIYEILENGITEEE